MATQTARKPGRPIGKLHQDDVRAKIQASQLVNRLTDHVLGKVELSATQVQAARILLGKTLPDLSSVNLDAQLEHSGGITVNIQQF